MGEIYIGANYAKPVYGETTTSITTSNIGSYFTVTSGTYTFTGSDSTWKATSNRRSTTMTITLEAKQDCTVSFTYGYTLYGNATSSRQGTYSITVAGETILSVTGGTSSKGGSTVSGSDTWSGSVSPGDSIVFTYYCGYTTTSTYYAQFSGVSVTTSVQTGTETVSNVACHVAGIYIGIGGVAREVKKAYLGVGGVARQIYGGVDVAKMAITYTGTMTDELVTMSGVKYRLLTLTESGTLALAKAVTAEVCVVGGGNGGRSNDAGGAGAYMVNCGVTDFKGGAAVIGAGGTADNVGSQSSMGTIASGEMPGNSYDYIGNGGTGGGNVGGKGDGLSKYPFGDTSYFQYPHCGGGGGGASYRSSISPNYSDGGAGGANGGDGGADTGYVSSASGKGGAGGEHGGGAGGGAGSYNINGGAATYYGSGGGGAGYQQGTGSGTAGAGYQGIIYIRIPLDQGA